MLLLAAALAGSAAAAPAWARVTWVASPSQPPHALEAGWEKGGPLFLCQAHYGNAVYPGKVINGNRCNVGYGGAEYRVETFRWAVGRGDWASPGQGARPVIGGYENGAPLFVCKAHYIDAAGVDRGWHPGKIINGRCNITWGGAELPQQVYLQLFQ